MEEKDFIKEKIVGQKGSWKKRGKKVILLFLSGMVFSLGAFLTAAFLFPLLPKTEKKKEKETVAFSESESTELEGSTEETEAIEDVVQSEIQKFDFPISAYDSMLGNLKNIIQEGICSRRKRSRETASFWKKPEIPYLSYFLGIAKKERNIGFAFSGKKKWKEQRFQRVKRTEF